jgi:hypothetical protein
MIGILTLTVTLDEVNLIIPASQNLTDSVFG